MDEYIKKQLSVAGAHEIENDLWCDGQRKVINYFFDGFDKDCTILDLGCGDGVGLLELRELGFDNLFGIDINTDKLAICEANGFDVECMDMQDLFTYYKYDVVFSSHSFEHALDPELVISLIHNILKPTGYLFMILPYPDTGPHDIHRASDTIGSRIDDEGATLIDWFTKHRFHVYHSKRDRYRESEIWLGMKPT